MKDLEHVRELNRLRVAAHRARAKSRKVSKIIEQKNCDCCGEEFEHPYDRFVVRDHHHLTGEWRGLICQGCNKRVGMLERGVPFATRGESIYRAYLSRYAPFHETPVKRPTVTGNVLVTPSEAEAYTEADLKALRNAQKNSSIGKSL